MEETLQGLLAVLLNGLAAPAAVAAADTTSAQEEQEAEDGVDMASGLLWGNACKQLSGHKTCSVHAAAFSPGAAQCPQHICTSDLQRGGGGTPNLGFRRSLLGPLRPVAAQMCRTCSRLRWLRAELLALLTP